ncbi:SpoIIE family protein phosphatase [Geodermatophilus sp. SYSU D00867]
MSIPADSLRQVPAEPAAAAGAGTEELAQARALIEHAPDAIVILDVDTGRFISVNAAAEELFGMDRAELLRVGPVQVSPPRQPDGRPSDQAAEAYVEQALAGGRPRFEWTHRRADGTPVPCEITLLRLPAADRRLVRGSILDITERRAAEDARAAAVAEQAARQAAEAGAARLEALVAGLNAVVWQRDPHTLRFTFLNDRVEDLLGYPAARWLAEPGLWERLLHPDDRATAVRRVHRAVADGEVDFSLTYRARTRDGRWLWLQHLGHVARDEHGRARSLHVVLTDVTAARRREQAAVMLAAAGRALSAGGPIEQRLGAVAGRTLGVLGERAVVWLADDDRYRLVAAAPAELATQVHGMPAVLAPEELRPLIAAGRPFDVGPLPEAMRREALAGDPVLERLAAADPTPRRQLVVPLQHGGERVGLLTFLTTDLARRYDEEDLALADELGQRIAATVAAERVTARARQLHELTAALSAAGTVAEAAAALADGLRAALGASVVSVCTLDADGLLHTVEARGCPPEQLARYAAMRLTAPFPIAEPARTRRPVWLGDRAALLARYPGIERHLQAATQAAAALPLTAADRVIGTLGVAFTTRRRFDAAERAFLRAVADQLAVALERATLADVRREMAETLQRSLLPARVPDVAGLQVVTRYLPAVRGTAAGGDWYDVLAVEDGSVALVVGDVVGHGAAAAAMGRLSSALHGMLLAGRSPARALELLDGLAEEVDGAALATVVCLLLDSAAGRLTCSSAGHPPPLLATPDGSVTYLDAGHGPALAVPGARRRPEAVTTLPSDAVLLLYTDGLIERRADDLDAGLTRLATAATARRGAPLATLVDGVLADLVDVGGARDDIAILAVRQLSQRDAPPPQRPAAFGPAARDR